MSLIAGINALNHNASLTLINNGRIVYAAEEERFDRVKYSDGVPRLALADGLRTIGAQPGDVDAIGYCWDWRCGVRPRVRAMAARAWDPVALYYLAGMDRRERLRNVRKLPASLRALGLRRARFHALPHHECHAASTFFASPYDRAAVLSVDGVGEWSTLWMGVGAGAVLRPVQSIGFPDSLGLVYDAITQWLGFHKRNDAGKVMGLAAYGNPARYRALFKELIRLEDRGRFRVNRRLITWHRFYGYGSSPLYSSRLATLLGRARSPDEPLRSEHKDVAAALQERFEETMLHVTHHLASSTGLKALALAGGCALNCLANTKIAEQSGFESVFVFPAATDAGAGAGAAMALSVRLDQSRTVLGSVSLGPSITEKESAAALADCGHPCERPADLTGRVAGLLAEGAVVGWAQGRMEFGPRALGWRSVLADPRSVAMKDRLNERVKHRESFRPFAPACPAEVASDWFDGPMPSPWMLFAARVRPEKQHLLGAVTHVDGSARLQTVDHNENPLFHKLLHAFGSRTGVPVLVNTSFNVAGEPVVATAEHAVRCFLSTGIDVLVVGPYVCVKNPCLP